MATTAKTHHPTSPPASSPTGDPYRCHIQANQTLWDAWTKLHLQPGIYGVEAFKAGQTSLKPIERDELGDVSGKTLLHLQCHFGLDTLSWARAGAIVTGADFSPAAVAAARALSDETGIPVRFVCSDVYALPDAAELRGERFDRVFTSYGTVTWLPDLSRWAQVIARFLTPGGVFYMVDRHPFVRLLFPRRTDSRGNPLDLGYFPRPEPACAEEHGSYADPESGVWTTAYYWSHSLGEIVTALCAAGLRLDYLHEFPPDEDERKLLVDGEQKHRDFPAWFSIRATAHPAGPARPSRARRVGHPHRREQRTVSDRRSASQERLP